MNRTIALSFAVLLAACGSHSSTTPPEHKLGAGINLGPQAKAVTLTTGNNNDLVVPDRGPGTIVRLAANASGSTLTGLAVAPFDDGDLFWIRNDGASGTLTITDSDAGSLLADRFLLPGGVSIALTPHMAVQCEYDGTATSFICSTAALANAPVGSETKTSGTASLTKLTTLTSTTATVAYTLPDGTFTGQRHAFEEITAASTPLGTLTITTPAGSESATHVFTAIGQRIVFEWNGTGWHMIEKHRAGVQVTVLGTTVLTGYDLCATYAMTVDGTKHSTTTMGIPNGLVPGEVIHLDTTAATNTPLGDIAITGLTIATGVAATSLAGINATTVQAGFLWDGAHWQNIALTTATFS